MSPRVLLVDDDPVILRLLEVNFRLEGFEVATASSGEQGLEAARREPPDAAVLDVMMPGLDGYEVARRLRDEGTLRDHQLVFLTARGVEADPQPELAGIERVAKPFDPAALVRLVRSRIGEPQG